MFDASPSLDVAAYLCTVLLLPGHTPVQCTVLPNVQPDISSEYVASLPETTVLPPGTALMGCVRAVDYSGNESECIGDSLTPPGSLPFKESQP